MTHHLLRRHVARGSDGKADRREVGRLARASSKPKVREHCPAVCVDQHVGRLEVAVHDAGVVRVLQPVTDLTQVAPGGERVERTSVEDVAQRAAADQRHREECVAVADLEVIDREDVGMVELGQRLRLGLEALDEAVVLEQL